jgi:hypothetical protein
VLHALYAAGSTRSTESESLGYTNTTPDSRTRLLPTYSNTHEEIGHVRYGVSCISHARRHGSKWKLTELVADLKPQPPRPRVVGLGVAVRHAPAPLPADSQLCRASRGDEEGEADEPETATPRHD